MELGLSCIRGGFEPTMQCMFFPSGLDLPRCLLPRLRRGGSNLDPNLVSPHLAAKPVHRLTADGRAAPVGQAKMPSVQWADDLAILDPAVAERASRMGTAPVESHEIAPASKNRQPDTRGIQRAPLAFDKLFHATDGQPLGHTDVPSESPGDRETNNLGLASEA